MSDKFLIHKPTGVIFIDQPAFSQRADFEVYTPPAQAPVADPLPVARAPRAPRAPKPVEAPAAPAPVVDEAALSADASRNLPD